MDYARHSTLTLIEHRGVLETWIADLDEAIINKEEPDPVLYAEMMIVTQMYQRLTTEIIRRLLEQIKPETKMQKFWKFARKL